MAHEVLRVLIAKEELDQMRKDLQTYKSFYDSHKQPAGQSTLTKAGSGVENPEESSDPCASKQCHCEQEDLESQEELNTMNVQQEPASNVTVETPVHSDLSNDEIVKRVWKKHQKRAYALLNELLKSPNFSIDKFGIVSVNGTSLHTSIWEILQLTFKATGKVVPNIDLYINLLHTLHLSNFISNKSLLIKDTPLSEYWYYIGNVSL